MSASAPLGDRTRAVTDSQLFDSSYSTPMMRQYAALKAENPDTLLLFRCGDFYETYAEDAEEAGRLLQITVTRKSAGADGDVAMAGVPYHALQGYLAKLVRLGRRVAIAEQTEDPKQAKGLVRREVVRVVTPGTAMEEGVLDDTANNHIVALVGGEQGTWGIAAADLSTGYFAMAECTGDTAAEAITDELSRLEVREILLPEELDADILRPILAERSIAITRRPAGDFRLDASRALLLDQFRVQSLEGFGAEQMHAAIRAAGALLRYLRDTQKRAVRHISDLKVQAAREGMVLDATTQRSLEIVRNLHGGGREGTLLSILDHTSTPMGARLLRMWLLQPLTDRAAIERRLDSVAELVDDGRLRARLGEALRGVRDIERIVSRNSLGSAGPRDLAALREALVRLPDVAALLLASKSAMLRELGTALNPVESLREELKQALTETPPASVGDGGVIREGYSTELDEILSASRDSKNWIATFRAREAQRTGIDKLKVSFNKVFGYYIELTQAQIRTLPDGELPSDYIRKQTLANAERFITPELKEKEDLILHAEERALTLEARLFDGLRERVAAQGRALLANAATLATVDCLRSLAEAAVKHRYARPTFSTDGAHEIIDGRHPVIEAIQPNPPFVANDLLLGNDTSRIGLITGPNMAGKSTYIRQAALISLMAQSGGFVPAREARLCIFDRIFTRVGAMDHLARGQSTFLVEMTEAANILRHATDDSLVILDEIGRGTSTYDGLAIAWAICESLHNTPGKRPRTLFATHYHELTGLEGALPRLRNLHVAVLEQEGRITFLFKVLPGSTDRSYGVHAAEYAGVPIAVVERAREILSLLDKGEPVAPRAASGEISTEAKAGGRKKARILPEAQPWQDRQLSLFDVAPPHTAVERLKQLDPNRLTPLEALAVLAELRRLVDE
jgi:DNA mismatch repair protein MutS